MADETHERGLPLVCLADDLGERLGRRGKSTKRVGLLRDLVPEDTAGASLIELLRW